MRIAVITERFDASIETFIWRHIRLLSADVVVENMDGGGFEHTSWRPHLVSLDHKVRSRESLARHMVRRLKEVSLGIKAPEWPKGMAEIWEQYVYERKPDVALAEYGPSGIKAMEPCKKSDVPLVVHFHGYDASSLLRLKPYRRQLPALFDNAAAVVVVSQQMKQTLERLGCPSPKLHVIPCGAPVTEFTITDAVENQPCRFLAVGRLIAMKDPLLTLRAFARCVNYCPDVTLTMIGDGKLYEKAKKWVWNASIDGKVSLLGHQMIGVVREYMAQCSAFVQHSVTTSMGHVEGCPVSIAEAASSGLPIVATKHGGIPDEVVDEETGFLVEEGDWKTMGDRMVLLANNPELRRKMGLAGRRNIEQVGNLELQIQKLRVVLAKAAEGKIVN